jgi:hypothetical protein
MRNRRQVTGANRLTVQTWKAREPASHLFPLILCSDLHMGETEAAGELSHQVLAYSSAARPGQQPVNPKGCDPCEAATDTLRDW